MGIGEKGGVTSNGHIFLGGDKTVLKLIVAIFAQFSEYIKNH